MGSEGDKAAKRKPDVANRDPAMQTFLDQKKMLENEGKNNED